MPVASGSWFCGSTSGWAACCHVDHGRFTLKADIATLPRYVRSAPDSYLPMVARYSLAQWAHLRWTRMLLGRGAGNPLLRGGCSFRPVRSCRNHMNDLVAVAFQEV